jgi:hypothetical protein
MPSHIYSKIYLHITWHTRDNIPSIKPDKAREYIRNQKQHHARGTMIADLEQTRSEEEEAP